ncbi:MAG: hypothetical protein AB7S48_03255 [Bacteroidales bacterium]
MKYISEILWLLSWPVLIYVSYKLSVWAIKYWEKKQPEENV